MQSWDFVHASVCVGRWEARIGIPGSKHIYLGLFNLEKEAAQAYDRALVRLRGTAAATNFALSDYRTDLAEYHKMQQVLMHTLPTSCFKRGTRLHTCMLVAVLGQPAWATSGLLRLRL